MRAQTRPRGCCGPTLDAAGHGPATQLGLHRVPQKDWPGLRGISYPTRGTEALERGFAWMSLCLENVSFLRERFFLAGCLM